MALTDYSSLEQEIMNTPEPKILAAGTTTKMRIISVRTGTSDKNGAKWFSPSFDVPEDPTVMEFNSFFWDPIDNDKLSPKQKFKNNNMFKDFIAAFGINLSRPINFEEDLIGLEGWGIVGVQKSEEYGDQNTVKKFVAGRR